MRADGRHQRDDGDLPSREKQLDLRSSLPRRRLRVQLARAVHFAQVRQDQAVVSKEEKDQELDFSSDQLPRGGLRENFSQPAVPFSRQVRP